jgi:cell division protein FtsL
VSSLLSGPAEDVVDVVTRVSSVRVLHSEARLLSACEEVVLVVVVVIVIVVVVSMAVAVAATRLQIAERPETALGLLAGGCWL